MLAMSSSQPTKVPTEETSEDENPTASSSSSESESEIRQPESEIRQRRNAGSQQDDGDEESVNKESTGNNH